MGLPPSGERILFCPLRPAARRTCDRSNRVFLERRSTAMQRTSLAALLTIGLTLVSTAAASRVDRALARRLHALRTRRSTTCRGRTPARRTKYRRRGRGRSIFGQRPQGAERGGWPGDSARRRQDAADRDRQRVDIDGRSRGRSSRQPHGLEFSQSRRVGLVARGLQLGGLSRGLGRQEGFPAQLARFRSGGRLQLHHAASPLSPDRAGRSGPQPAC